MTQEGDGIRNPAALFFFFTGATYCRTAWAIVLFIVFIPILYYNMHKRFTHPQYGTE